MRVSEPEKGRTSGQGQSLSSAGVWMIGRNGHSISVTNPAHLHYRAISVMPSALCADSPALA